jgi:hypothetical protein
LIADRLPRVYNDMKVVEEWTRWLGRITGIGDGGGEVWGDVRKEEWQDDEEINRAFTRMQAMQKEGGENAASGGETERGMSAIPLNPNTHPLLPPTHVILILGFARRRGRQQQARRSCGERS